MFVHFKSPHWAWLLLLVAASSAASELGLREAERLALEHAPWFAHHRSNVAAASERVVSENTLPDPQLTLGAVNVPTDSFKLDQEDMTMVMVGVRQTFPPGDTLALKQRRAEKELDRERARLEMERRNVLRQVRTAWLELYYQERSLALIREVRVVLQAQVQGAENRYRAAQETQQSLLRSRQSLARLDEREQGVRAQAIRLRGQLARWIGVEAAQRPLPDTLPGFPRLPVEFDATRHPDWIAANAMLETARTEVDLVRQEYKPGFMAELSYGARQAGRTDMVTALVTVDLPIFRSQRQDRRLAERQAAETGARFEAEDKKRELEAMYAAAHAEHDALATRARIYADQLLPDIQREARLTTAGFARDQAELREARMKELDAEIELTRLRVDLVRSHVELLYLKGEDTP
ncbi:MAG: TolC family protein [Pseudomonadota bacterium]|nr:MAG: TolC family protein [Pseudomonadota bacterium]